MINGHAAPIAGRPSMDMITVDVSALGRVRLGDEAILWGDSPPVSEIADSAGTISYQLLTGVSRRVTRRYVNR
jgi:alanine racemase